MWRQILRGFGCLGYLGLLGVIFALVSYVAFSQFVRRGVTPTPELFGLTEDEAEALLADQGLSLEWSEEGERYDDEVPAGRILMQKPRAGTLVKRGRAVTVVLSRGPRLIEVPPVTGEALQAAQVTLVAAGLRLGRTAQVFSTDGESGTVVSQDPPGGERVEREAPIDLFLSKANPIATYVMPDLVNHDYDQVRSFFERRGFRLGRVSYETYDGIAPGTVLRQFPLAGHPLRRGDVIALGVVTPAAPETPEEAETTDATDTAETPGAASAGAGEVGP
jgi:serine/threonine-protein kinase